MEFFKRVTKIDFMHLKKYAAVFSAVVFVLSLISLWQYGLNLGLDFTGGTQVEVQYQQAANLQEIRDRLQQTSFPRAVVQSYGTSEDVLISIPAESEASSKAIGEKVVNLLPGATMRRVDFIGPQVGRELTSLGILAVVVSLICTMLYIMFRFEYRFAISSTIALIHDPVLILGVFAYFQLEFNLIALSSLLAILGYSLNDTVVVFDRVRENFRKMRRATAEEVVNLSINQTLSRTIMTSGLTLLVVLALFIYGGESLRGFSLSFIIGIVIGTYSSIYVAGALAVVMGLNKQDLMPKESAPIDESP